MLGEHSLAVDDYDRGIKLSPGNLSRYAGRGVVLFIMVRLEEAIRDFDEVLRLGEPRKGFPNQGFAPALQPQVYNNLGQRLLPIGPHRKSPRGLRPGIQLSRRSAEFYINRALAYAVLDKDAEAQRDFEQAKQLGFEEAIDIQAAESTPLGGR